MAYLVSQMRKGNVSDKGYMTSIATTPSYIRSPNPFGFDQGRDFQDFALAGNFEVGKVYYLRFKVHRIPRYFYSGSKSPIQVSTYSADADYLTLQILLKNENENDEQTIPPEIIGTCSVPTFMDTSQEDENSLYAFYSFVFIPSKNFNRLGFRIARVSFDALNVKVSEGGQSTIPTGSTGARDWLYDQYRVTVESDFNLNIIDSPRYTGAQDSSGNWIQVNVSTVGDRIECLDICQLNNLITNNTEWVKFGFQSRPGSLIVVNGQPIRVGRSGIYELNNGTKINSFMIASPGGSDPDKIDAFLLDYAYKSKGGN